MKIHFRAPSGATVIASLALVVAVGGGTAFAATQMLANDSVGTAQLKYHAVTRAKIATGAVGVEKLAPGAKQALKGDRGPAGPKGATGKQGPAGKNGSAATAVTTLTGTWVDHSGGGKSAITANGVELSGTGPTGYAGISTTALNNFTPADLSTISYTQKYTQATDSHTAAPYFKLKLQPANGECGADDVVYNPTVQSANLSYAGQTETFNVTAPYSTVGVNNDANPVDGSYPVALHSAKNGAGKDVSGEKICLAEIILDGGSGANGATATIYDVTFGGGALESRTYAFGS